MRATKAKIHVMTSRRDFFKYAGIAGGAVAASSVSRVAMAALPEPVIQTSPNTMAPLVPNSVSRLIKTRWFKIFYNGLSGTKIA